MKRLTIAGMILSLSLLLSGCFAIEKYYQWKYAREKEEIIKIVESEEAKKIFEDVVLFIEKDAFTPSGTFQSYTIKQDSLHYTPMGSIHVTIYLNDDPTLDINCQLIQDKTKGLELANAVYAAELRRYFYD